MIARLFTCGFILLIACRAQAAAPSFDWADRLATYRIYWDDPRPLLAAAEKILPTIDPEKEPKLWLQVFCAFGMSNDYIHEYPRIDMHIKTAKKIARELGAWEWMIDILIIEGAYVESQRGDISVPYEAALRLAEEHQSKREAYLVFRNYMGHLVNIGASTQVMKFFANAPQDLLENRITSDIDRLNLKKNLVYVSKLASNSEGILRYTTEIAEECRTFAFRTFCAYALYDYGVLLSSGRVPLNFPGALAALTAAEDLARQLDDQSILGIIYVMFTQIMHNQKKPEEALRYATLASEFGRNVGNYNTVADATLVGGDSLRILRRYPEALAMLEKLKKELPQDLLQARGQLHKLMADIYSETANWPQAYEERTRQVELEKKFLAEKMKDDFSRQTVQLGLDLEQEKNKALQGEQRSIVILVLAVLAVALVLLIGLVSARRKNREISKLHIFIETQVLQRFLPPKIVGEILAGKSHFEQKAQSRVVTVLFADLVSFTASAERMVPHDLSELLNRFFAVMSDIVFEHGGVVDKFMGDAIMVVFGAAQELTPLEQSEYSTRCAQHLMEGLQNLNQEWQERFGISFAMRIGIHQGHGVVGTFGSTRRADYTVIGHTVNLASRIEGKAAPDQILVSESIASHLPEHIRSYIGSFQLKGIEQPVALFAVRTPRDLQNAG